MKLRDSQIGVEVNLVLSAICCTAHAQSATLQRVGAAAAEVPVAAGKPLQLSLADLMKVYNVPGMGIDHRELQDCRREKLWRN